MPEDSSGLLPAREPFPTIHPPAREVTGTQGTRGSSPNRTTLARWPTGRASPADELSHISSSRSAAASSRPSKRWPYVSRVVFIEACPSRDWITLGCSPWATRSAACVCRRSWNVHGSPTDSRTAGRTDPSAEIGPPHWTVALRREGARSHRGRLRGVERSPPPEPRYGRLPGCSRRSTRTTSQDRRPAIWLGFRHRWLPRRVARTRRPNGQSARRPGHTSRWGCRPG